MPYFINASSISPIAFTSKGTRIYKLSELPKIEFPTVIRVTEDYLGIDGTVFPHALMQKKTMLWLQRMWRIWGEFGGGYGARHLLNDAMESLVDELGFWGPFADAQEGASSPR